MRDGRLFNSAENFPKFMKHVLPRFSRLDHGRMDQKSLVMIGMCEALFDGIPQGIVCYSLLLSYSLH